MMSKPLSKYATGLDSSINPSTKVLVLSIHAIGMRFETPKCVEILAEK
jgi:hypothetical protein